MKIITETIAGLIIQDDGLSVVWLAEDAEDGPRVHLAYALVTLGPEQHVFPGLVLDDWGKEMTGIEVYEWMQENGNAFPRAEIFAVGIAGDERQQFLREFDLTARYPVYALPSRRSPVTDAVRVRAIVMTDDSVDEPTRTERPPEITGPLTRARLSWWRVPSSYQGLGFISPQSEPM